MLQIEKLKKQAADKDAELLRLLELTPAKMWNTDLDNFLEEYKVRTCSPLQRIARSRLPTVVLPVLGEQGHRAGPGRKEEQAQATHARSNDEEGSQEGEL